MRCTSYEDWEITSPRGGTDAKTLVLVGKTGNGKSATGNSIIGRQVFESMPSLGGVTSTCQFASTVLDDGQILNVVDTPGLFDSAVEPHEMAKEIGKCINMAKEGIHAVLLVLSLRNRFSEEEASAFESLLEIFGGKIADYMIVVFAHGDVLRNGMCLDDLLARNCPAPLKRTLEMCGNRRISFDNFTEDIAKISRQRKELLSLVEAVVESNGGKPYTNDLFDQLKKAEMNRIDQTSEVLSSMGEMNLIDHATKGKPREKNSQKSYEEKFERLIETVELRLNSCIRKLETQLAEEKAARLEAEKKALEAHSQSKDEVLKLKERLKRAEELSKKWSCVIM